MASMMGCLGVWVTDAFKPEELGDCVQLTYNDNSEPVTYQIMNTDTIIIDWGDSINSYPASPIDVQSPSRIIKSVGDVKIYNPENITYLQIASSYLSGITGINYLTSATQVYINMQDIVDLVIPDGLDAIDQLEIGVQFEGDSITLLEGNPTMTQFAVWGNGALSPVTTITIPIDLVNLSSILIEGTPNVETITVHKEWVDCLVYYFIDMALTESCVNAILVELDSRTSAVGLVVNLSGGTSSAPSGAGAVAKASLIGKGADVTTN